MGKVIIASGVDVKNLNPAFWMRVQQAIASHRCDVTIYSAYRSYAKQAYLYALYLAHLGNPANKPGTSFHEIGLAVDEFPADKDYAALADTMRAAGLTTVSSAEPWHWQGSKDVFLQVVKTVATEGGSVALPLAIIGGAVVASVLIYKRYSK